GSVLLAALDGAPPEVVAESAGAILGPRAAVDAAGRLWVAWQQWPAWPGRDGPLSAAPAAPQVVAAVRNGTAAAGASAAWSTAEALSPDGQPAWAPSLAAGSDGRLWCAWDAWTGSAYQVYVASAPADGGWGAALQVSGVSGTNGGGAANTANARYFHLAPDIAAEGDRAWVVWSRTPRWGELNHRFNHLRSLHAAVVVAGDETGEHGGGEPNRLAPLDERGYLGGLVACPAPGRLVVGEAGRLPVHAVPFLHSAEEEFVNPLAPRVVATADGPVVFFRQFRSTAFKDFGWAIHAVRHTGHDWTVPEAVTAATGFPDTPYGVLAGVASSPVEGPRWRDWLVAYHAGEYPRLPNTHPSRPVQRHRVLVERVAPPDPGSAHARAMPSISSASSVSAAPNDQPVVVRSVPLSPPSPASPANPPVPAARPPARRITADGRTYTLLYGDLHRHSAYSKCMSANDGDPLDHWRWVQDVAGLDFYAITEHLEYMSYVEWRRIEDLAERLAAGGGVLALCGFELAIPPGHTNFFYADQGVGRDLRVACLSSADLAAVWPKLDAWLSPEQVVAIRHHQGHRGDVAASYAPQYEPVVEIIQTRGEYPGWVQSLWRQGFRVGVVGASDHARGAPFVQGVTGLWLPAGERSREAVLAGLRARRTFATNGPRMSVLLSATSATATAGGPMVVMGGSGSVAGPPRLVVEAAGTRALEAVAFYRDDRLLHVEPTDSPEATAAYTDHSAPPGEHAYWVRVTQGPERNGRRPPYGVAYSSPVWLTVEGGGR
ncbi:MAG: hypothetical protein ACRDI2_02710, partial [Chloroflexota bacterium]